MPSTPPATHPPLYPYPRRIDSNKRLSLALPKRFRLPLYLLSGACALGMGASVLWASLEPAASKSMRASDSLSFQDPVIESAAAGLSTALEGIKLQEAATSATANASASTLPVSMQLQVANGDTLIQMLTDTGLAYEEAHQAVQAIREIYDPRQLDVGQHIMVSLDASEENPQAPVLSSLSIPISVTESVELERKDSGSFMVKKIDAPLSKKAVRAGGVIKSSLFETGQRLGIPASMLSELVKVYSYDVDFQRDIQPGNSLEVVFERLQTEDGQAAGHGDLLYASLNLSSKTLPIYRYTDKSGNTDYYNEKGESLRKALLKTPINGARISSGFGMRHHPVLGYSKMHRGMDFAAATGTPIYAAGDGVVAYAGAKGSYGNYVQIKHNGKYSTAYAHASRIASGIKPGMRVKQGQVIAYVGTTGRSTGPHLHYEVLVAGSQVNPSGVKFKTGNSLSGKELAAFRRNVEQVQAALKGTRERKVASVQTGKTKAAN